MHVLITTAYTGRLHYTENTAAWDGRCQQSWTDRTVHYTDDTVFECRPTLRSRSSVLPSNIRTWPRIATFHQRISSVYKETHVIEIQHWNQTNQKPRSQQTTGSVRISVRWEQMRFACFNTELTTRCFCVDIGYKTLNSLYTTIGLPQPTHQPPRQRTATPLLLHCPLNQDWSRGLCATSVWNSLPASVIGSDSLSVFKSRLKHSYFVGPVASTYNRLPPVPLKLWHYGALQICLLLLLLLLLL